MATKKPNGFYSKMSDTGLRRFYDDNYRGMLRSQVEKVNSTLIATMRSRGVIRHIPLTDNQKPSGFYTRMTETEILQYCSRIYGDINRAELKKKDSGLHRALSNRRLLNKIMSKRTSKKKLKNWEYVRARLEDIIKRNKGKFPAQYQFTEMGESSIQNAIGRYHGGVNSVRKRMGYMVVQVPKFYHQKWNNFKKDMRKAIEKNGGNFPTRNWLAKNGYAPLNNAIGLYHGGVNSVRKRMGYSDARASPGHWLKWENVSRTIKELSDKLGHFPSTVEMSSSGYSSLPIVIQKRYGGLKAVRKRMGYIEPHETGESSLLEQYVGIQKD